MYSSKISVDRVGVLLEPDTSDSREAEGILNPAVAGDYLLYRAVGRNNFSRIMAAQLTRVKTERGVLVSAKKLGLAVLEPSESYEITRLGLGGIEDPRVTELPSGGYVMFYIGYGKATGFKKRTPVVAVATSSDGLTWQRHGRLTYEIYNHQGNFIDFNTIANKDTVLFSEKINGKYALLHRPMFTQLQAARLGLPRRGIWYAESDSLTGPWGNHALVLGPYYDWEYGGVGAGVPPIHSHDIWINIYHGFTKAKRSRQYNAGVFITPLARPKDIVYRSNHAILEPAMQEEQSGIVPRVVFPTAVWPLEQNNSTMALFWGAADTRIMWGVLRLPSDVLIPAVSSLPPGV